jgi:hypothetical protein
MRYAARQMRPFHLGLSLTALVLSACLITRAERLPLRAYTVTEAAE